MSGSLDAARQQLPRPLTRREQTLDEMLDHLTDVQEVCVDRAGTGMGDGGVIQMPAAWNESYRELDRVLARMRGLATTEGQASPGFRKLYVNLRGWYLTPTVVLRYKTVKKVNGRLLDCRHCGAKGVLHEQRKGDSRDRARCVVRNGLAPLVLLALEWAGGEFVGEPYKPLCRDCKTAGRGSHPVWACQCVSGLAA